MAKSNAPSTTCPTSAFPQQSAACGGRECASQRSAHMRTHDLPAQELEEESRLPPTSGPGCKPRGSVRWRFQAAAARIGGPSDRPPLCITMQRALERALDHADRVIESAQQRPPKRKSSSIEEKSLHEKLYDIYVEECGKEPEVTEELMRNVNLLEKLVQRESLPHLVVNLYPGEEGYSLMIKGENELYSETIRLPHEERDFLEYLDSEQLSPDLVDVLEKSQVNIFQSGCVITEVRDYRQCTDVDRSGYQSRHVLLRPTMQTLASDIQSITSDNQIWSQEDRLALESQLILATAEPLCLDPSVSVACIENKLLYNKQKMNAPPMKRSLQNYSAASLNPEPEVSCSPPPPELRAWAPDQKSEESQADQLDDLDIFKEENFVDMWEQLPFDLDVPSDFDVEKFAADWPFKYDDAHSIVWPDLEAQDDSLFGCEAGDPSRITKPTVMQSLNDPLISGKMPREKVRCGQMSHHHSFADDHSYSLMPGSQTGAGKAGRQSKKLVKKRDKCPVRVPQGSSGCTSPSQLSPKRAAEQPQAVSVPSAVLGKGGQHTAPAVSLPCSSGKSSLGKPFPSQQASRVRAFPSRAPAWQPPNLPQKSSVEVNRVRRLPTATVSSASASHITPVIQIKATSADPKVIQLIGPVRIVRTVVRGYNPVQGSGLGATASSGVKPSSLSSGDQPQNAEPAAPRAPSQGGVQYVLGTLSSLRPVRVLWVPQGSDISNILQQAQQPQQLLCHLISQSLHQQVTPTSHLQQPVVQVSRAQGPSSQPKGLSAQQAAAFNLNGVGSVLQPQQAQLSQPGSAQTSPGQNASQQLVQLPSAFQQLPQSQLVQWRVLPLSEAVATASVVPAQPGGGQETAGQAEGEGEGDLPSTPRC